MSGSDDVFWVVWQPDSGNPRYRHETRDGAIKEAERLAANSQGIEFFVLQAVSVSVSNTVRTTRLDEIPW